MNEEYLKGYFNTYVKPQRADATYEDWVSKISNNDEYKRGMFNTYVKPSKSDASYDDWNAKVFGTTQPTVEQKKNQPVPTQDVQETTTTATGQIAAPTATNQVDFDNRFGSFIGGIVNEVVAEKQNRESFEINYGSAKSVGAQGLNVIKPSTYAKAGVDIAQQEELSAEEVKPKEDGYGKRVDGTEKGTGYFGELKRPDGSISTELSIGVEFDGEETQIPLLVPTLTKKEVDYLLEGNAPTKEITDKSIEHAKMRMKEGKSPFAEVGEEVSVDALEYGKNVQKKIVEMPTEVEINVMRGYENPYSFGQREFYEYENKKQELKNFEDGLKDWVEQTDYDMSDYMKYNAMYELEFTKWLNDNPDPSQADFDKFNNSVWTKFEDSKKISLSGENKTMKGGAEELLRDKDYLLRFIAPVATGIYTAIMGKDKFNELAENIGYEADKMAYRADYAVNSIMSNTLVGKGITAIESAANSLIYNDASMGEYYRKYQQERAKTLSTYKDMSTLQNIAESAYLIGVDFLPFAGMGSLSAKAVGAGWKYAANILSKIGVPSTIADITAVKAVLGFAKQGLQTGATLFQYEAAQEATSQLASKKISELDIESYKQIFKRGANGFASGFAVGVLGGVSEMVLQRINSQMVSKMYQVGADGKMVITAGNKSAQLKLINALGFTATGILEGGVFAAMQQYHETGSFKEMSVEKFFEEGLKFLVGIKAQGAGAAIKNIKSGFVSDKSFKPEKSFTGEYAEYSPLELRMMGVKDVADLKNKINDGKINEVIKDTPVVTRLKVIYDAYGLQAKKTFDIDASTAEFVKKDNSWYLISTDGERNIIDIRKCENEKEARDLETWSEDFNIGKRAIKSVGALSPKNVRLLNSEYADRTDAIITINEALRKAPSDRSDKENKALIELNEKASRYNDIQKKEDAELSSKIKEAETGKEVKPETEVETETKTKEYDTQDKTGLSGEVGKGQEPIETEPIKETGGEKTETGRDVQASKKEVVDKEAKGELAMSVGGGSAGARIDLMAEIRKSAKSAKKDIANLVTEIKSKIKSAKDSGKLTQAQYDAVLTGIDKAARGRNFEAKKQKLLEYVDEKLASAEMRQDVETARSNMSKLKKNIKSKRNIYGDEYARVEEALDIDLNTTDPETIQRYNEIVSEFNAIGGRPRIEQIEKFVNDIAELEFTKTEKKIKTKADVDSYIEKVSAAEINDAKSLRSAMNNVRRARSIANKLLSDGLITEQEYREVVAKMEENSDSLTNKLKDKEAEIKKELINNITETANEIVKERSNYDYDNDLGLSKNQVLIVDKALANLNHKGVKEGLSVADADTIAYALSNIRDGFINGETWVGLSKISEAKARVRWTDALRQMMKSKNWRKLSGFKVGLSAKFADTNLAKFFNVSKMNRNDYASIKAVINSLDAHRIGQYFGTLSHKIMEALVGQTTRNIGVAKNNISRMSKPFNEASKALRNDYVGDKALGKIAGEIRGEYRKKFARAKLAESKRRIAFILLERMYQSNEKPTKEANYMDAVANNVTPDQTRSPKDFVKDMASWASFKNESELNSDGSINIDAAIAKLTPAERKYYDTILELNKETEVLIKDATEINGRRFVKINNYDFFHIIKETTRDKSKKYDSVEEMMANYKEGMGEAGSTYNRNMIPKYIDLNLDNVIRRQIKEANYNVFVKPDFMANHRAMESVKNDIQKEQKTDKEAAGVRIMSAFQETAIKRLVIEQNKEVIEEADRVLNDVVSFFSRKVLAMPTRIINELTTNVVRNVHAQGDLDIINNPEQKKAYGDLISQYIHNTKDYGNYAEYYGNSSSKFGESIDWLLTFSDKAIVPATFKSSFKKNFKRITGTEFNEWSYNDSYDYRYEYHQAIEEASLAAIARTEELFNVKTPLGASPNILFFKVLGNAATLSRNKPITKALFFLQSFNMNELNQVKRAWLRMKQLQYGDKKSFFQGLNDFSAITISNFMYLTIGRALREMAKPVFSYLFSGGDDDDVAGGVEDNMIKFIEENFTKKALAGQLAASLYSLSLGKYGAITPFASGALLGSLKNETGKGDKEYDELYASIEDLAGQAYIRPINSGYGSTTQWAKSINPVITEIVSFVEFLQMGGEVGVDTYNYIADDDDIDETRMAVFLNSLFNYAFLNPVTNYADKQLRYYYSEKKKREKEAEKEAKKK